ncbi:MAG: lysophospholipid acyltransferase family protein [Planctomycetota bacterium]|nr:lysophospholipid acyltransferase family protein [Planctomycetota bacterium]
MRQYHNKPLGKFVGYIVSRFVFRLIGLLCFGYHCQGRQHIPKQGGALICANHQSNLDPALVGMASARHWRYLARKSLFTHPLFGRVITMLDAIPLDRDGMGIQGIKATLKCLRSGAVVLIFPEGTRTKTGELQRLKGGFIAIARRARVPLIPCGFDGAYDSLPRGSGIPDFQRVRCIYGAPIGVAEIESLTDDQLLAMVQQRIEQCIEKARISRH